MNKGSFKLMIIMNCVAFMAIIVKLFALYYDSEPWLNWAEITISVSATIAAIDVVVELIKWELREIKRKLKEWWDSRKK